MDRAQVWWWWQRHGRRPARRCLPGVPRRLLGRLAPEPARPQRRADGARRPERLRQEHRPATDRRPGALAGHHQHRRPVSQHYPGSATFAIVFEPPPSTPTSPPPRTSASASPAQAAGRGDRAAGRGRARCYGGLPGPQAKTLSAGQRSGAVGGPGAGAGGVPARRAAHPPGRRRAHRLPHRAGPVRRGWGSRPSTSPTTIPGQAIGDRVAVMRAGRIEQLDEPRSLYLRPANTFVATSGATRR